MTEKQIKTKHKIFSIDSLVRQCGYFYCGEVNNGYNCTHPKQEEKQNGEGCCYAWSCPLGYEADEEDFGNSEIDNDGYTECIEGEFVVCEVDENGELISEVKE